MRVRTLLVAAMLCPAWLPAQASAQTSPTIQQYLSPGLPYELVAAKKAERIAWIAYEQGERNVYTAAAPAFRPMRLTDFKGDNGIDLTGLAISDDGAVVTFVRGHAPNRQGWVANPASDPRGADRSVWVATTTGGSPRRISEATSPALSPDGRWVAFARDGQIYRVPVRRAPANAAERGEQPFIKVWGVNSNPVWSPDGNRLAFVSSRVDHSFAVVYDLRKETLVYMSPSVDRDTNPAWSPDSSKIAFIRRPGFPFGQQTQAGTGSIGNPAGPAAAAGRTGGREMPAARQPGYNIPPVPGLASAAFRGGYTLSLQVADAATGKGREFWHNAPNDASFASITGLQWAGLERVVFQAEPEEWIRYFSVPIDGSGASDPLTLTPGEGMLEHVSLSQDGRTLFYTTNVGDIDRRHLWKVPTSGGQAEQITKGEDIETYPAVVGAGARVALLSAGPKRPQSVGIIPAAGGVPRLIYPPLAAFPTERHVTPEQVVIKAPDGLQIHNQLFVPRDLKPGERRPAVLFVHGGPVRQMLLGYHYRFFYHLAYGVNQYLADQGYVVLSVNFRSGIGYGKSFRMAPNRGARGNSEYQDVLAAGEYLRSRPDVDPGRIGIWGLSYGGLLTAQALARNSDLFAAGVDMAGVHLQGSSLDPESVSYRSSAISEIGKWKSPVLLIHGDDDRNVAFSQTTGLVQLLRAHDIEHELIVYPDEVHDPLLHGRWLYGFQRMDDFFRRHLREKAAAPAGDGAR